MARRSVSWRKGFYKDLRDPEFARAFILVALEEEVDLRGVIADIVQAYGVKEYACMCGIAGPNLLRFTKEDYNPTMNTMNQVLKPFGLQVGVMPLKKSKGVAKRKRM